MPLIRGIFLYSLLTCLSTIMNTNTNTEADSTSSPKPIKVWGLPVRMFHWSLAHVCRD